MWIKAKMLSLHITIRLCLKKLLNETGEKATPFIFMANLEWHPIDLRRDFWFAIWCAKFACVLLKINHFYNLQQFKRYASFYSLRVTVHCKIKRVDLAPKMGPKRVSPVWYSLRVNSAPLKWGCFWHQLWGWIDPVVGAKLDHVKGEFENTGATLKFIGAKTARNGNSPPQNCLSSLQAEEVKQ